MRDLMREIVNKIYTFFVKGEDPDFVAFSDYVRPATYEWDKPKIDSVMMHHVKEYARGRGKNARRSSRTRETGWRRCVLRERSVWSGPGPCMTGRGPAPRS